MRLLAVADVPREHGSAGDDGSEDRGEERLRRRVHIYDGRAGVAATFASAGCEAPNVHCSVHVLTPTGHLAYLRSRHARSFPRPARVDLRRPRRDLLPGRGRPSPAPTEALLKGDAEIAERVISADAEIDRARVRVEDTAFSLLSLQQPVAGDLRVVVAALRMVTELERMGDLSVHVAKIARLRVPNIAVPEEIRPTVEPDGRGRRGHGQAGARR